MTSSELLHFRKCDSTAWRVRNNVSSSGFELAWESVVFRAFPAVFARLFVTQQRRTNGWKACEKCDEKWIWNVRESENFLLMYVSIFGQFCVLLSSSLWNISREKFFQAFKKPSGHSRDTVKPVLSGHRIKRTPSIKRTIVEVPKFISLIYFKWNLY